jgi:hypothetical protein
VVYVRGLFSTDSEKTHDRIIYALVAVVLFSLCAYLVVFTPMLFNADGLS